MSDLVERLRYLVAEYKAGRWRRYEQVRDTMEEAADALERKFESGAMQALGWASVEFAERHKAGEDISNIEVSELAAKMASDLGLPEPPQD